METRTLTEEIRFTYEDYLRLPDDGKQYQIVGGELYMSPAPVPYHQRILLNLSMVLQHFVAERDLGSVWIAPCDIVLSDEDVVEPDLFFISKEREDIVGDTYIEEAPDLAVEILSPSTSKLDRTIKMRLYERSGVREYWVVDPERKRIEVLNLTDRGYLRAGIYGAEEHLESVLLNGLMVNVSEVFARK